MKTASIALVNFVNSAKQCLQFDLWTFFLASNTWVWWTDADVDVQLDDGRHFSRGPVITRDKITWARGIEVDQLKATFQGPGVLVNGQALPAFAAAGGFDGAWTTLERLYMNDAGVVQGTLVSFQGPVADVTPGRRGAELVIKSQLTQLTQQLPRNLYQAGCLNTLYDSNCGVDRAAATVAGTVTAVGAGYNPVITATMASSVASRYFELGPLNFTAGANAGFGRTVQSQPGSGTSIAFQFSRPWPFPIAVGDTFTACAGCDKLQATCSGKFNNLARFRGQPYIPVPETVT